MATFIAAVTDRNAVFVGQAPMLEDGTVHVLLCTWSGDGTSSSTVDFLGDHGRDAVHIVATPETLARDWVLLGPLPTSDALHQWAATDFYRVVGG